MDKVDHPEINTSGLTAEVRKAMARQALKSHALPTQSSAIDETSLPANAGGPEKDNSTQAKRLSTENFASIESQLTPLPKSPKLQPEPVFEPNGNDQYQLNDLLKFHDGDFVNAAYRAILKREPDTVGYNNSLDQLREGHLDKIDILASLRFSPEGRLKNVQIKGLAVPTFVRRLGHLPLIGYPIRLGVGLLRVPSLIHRVRRDEAYTFAQNRRFAEHIDEVAKHADTLSEALTGYLSNLSVATADLFSRSELQDDRHDHVLHRLDTLVAQQKQEARVKQQHLETLVKRHEQLLAELRQELTAQIDAERTSSQEQNQRLFHEQTSLLESSTNDTRNRIAQLETSANASIAQLKTSTDASIAQLKTSTDARIAQLETSTDARIAQLEISAHDWIAQLESSARAWITQLESSVRAEIASVGVSTSDIRTKITEAEAVTGDLRARISQVESSSDDLRARISQVESSSDDLRSTTDQLESATNTTQAEVEKVYQQLQHARTELAVQGRRMALILEEARRRLPAPFDQQQLETIATEEQHHLDALYAELEDNFRGSHDEIKDRFKIYLPHIKSLDLTNDLPIVDLGCGRGEWLELLKEEDHRALGVDTNRVLLDRCRGRGLDVVEADVLQYLRRLPDNSLGAITAFHIIEHLEIEILLQLLDEIVRVVHPGGVVIFETPNPENVLVGSNYFYFDPTHRNPLPSLLMKFLLESRGLHRVEVMSLHAWDQARLGGKNALTARFNELFYGPMDYAITGWKVSA